MRSILLVVLLACAYGQEFDVATVRVNKLDENPTAEFSPGGQITLRYVTMRTLIAIAWKETQILPEFTALTISATDATAQLRPADYLKGGPSWLMSDHFDVLAKAPPGTSTDDIRLMFQKLLKDRFHLAVHREQKVLKVYAMVAAKGGFKLTESKTPGEPVCSPSISDDNMYHRDCHNMTMALLAEQLVSYAPRFFGGKPVVNQTDLKGAYDFRIDWAPLSGGLNGLNAPADAQFDSGTTIFQTMERKLGLKLDQREQSMPVIVIDQVDRVPTEN